MKINELGLSDFDVRVYNKLVQSKGRIGKDKLFLGDKWLASEVNFIKCSGQELKDALKNLVNVNLITPQTRGKLYNEYFTINDLDNAQSPMPFDDDFIREVNMKPVVNGVPKIDLINSAIHELFPEFNTAKEYLEKVYKNCGKFRVGRKTIEYIADRTGIEAGIYVSEKDKKAPDTTVAKILADLAYEINPINGDYTHILTEKDLIMNMNKYHLYNSEIEMCAFNIPVAGVYRYDDYSNEFFYLRENGGEYSMCVCGYVMDNLGVKIMFHDKAFEEITDMVLNEYRKETELKLDNLTFKTTNEKKYADTYECSVKLTKEEYDILYEKYHTPQENETPVTDDTPIRMRIACSDERKK